MKIQLTPVAPTRPIAPWLGGKRNLAKRICALIDADTAHHTYAEPFVGMCSLCSTSGTRSVSGQRLRLWHTTKEELELKSCIFLALAGFFGP